MRVEDHKKRMQTYVQARCTSGQECICAMKKYWWSTECDLYKKYIVFDATDAYNVLMVLGKNACFKDIVFSAITFDFCVKLIGTPWVLFLAPTYQM